MCVHRTTAFRWRQGFLQLPATVHASARSCIAEVDETYTLTQTLASAARVCHLEHNSLNTARVEHRRGAWLIQNVDACHSRWQTWMVCFHGVAMSQLENYLGWFRVLDRNAQRGAPAASLLALAIVV